MTYEEADKSLSKRFGAFGHTISYLFYQHNFPVWVQGTTKINAPAGINDVRDFRDVEILCWRTYGTAGNDNSDYVLVHKVHEKFGKHIVEIGDNRIKDDGAVFLDWSKFEGLYRFYVLADDAYGKLHIPFYDSVTEDRHFYKTNQTDWYEDYDDDAI